MDSFTIVEAATVIEIDVNSRMGDVDDFVTRLKMFDAPLDADYFADAMDYFREEYDPVAFLYVSNDMKWTREHIPNDKGQLSSLAGNSLELQYSAYWII